MPLTLAICARSEKKEEEEEAGAATSNNSLLANEREKSRSQSIQSIYFNGCAIKTTHYISCFFFPSTILHYM